MSHLPSSPHKHLNFASSKLNCWKITMRSSYDFSNVGEVYISFYDRGRFHLSIIKGQIKWMAMEAPPAALDPPTHPPIPFCTPQRLLTNAALTFQQNRPPVKNTSLGWADNRVDFPAGLWKKSSSGDTSVNTVGSSVSVRPVTSCMASLMFSSGWS